MSILIHKMVLKVRGAWVNLAEIIFPRFCLGCLKKGQYICGTCRGEALEPEISYPKNSEFAVTSASYRHPAVKKAVRKLKYDSASDIAGELAEIIAKDLAPYLKYGEKPVLCEIPITDSRKKARGFNQAGLLAGHLAEKLGLERRPMLVKTRETRPQAEIKNRKERLKNVKNVFAFNKNFSAPPFVIIIDDIITTGATMNEAARVLKKSGVKKIICAAVAG